MWFETFNNEKYLLLKINHELIFLKKKTDSKSIKDIHNF